MTQPFSWTLIISRGKNANFDWTPPQHWASGDCRGKKKALPSCQAAIALPWGPSLSQLHLLLLWPPLMPEPFHHDLNQSVAGIRSADALKARFYPLLGL